MTRPVTSASGQTNRPLPISAASTAVRSRIAPKHSRRPALPDGSHTIAVRARNSVGVLDPTPATYTWTVDTAPPDTNFVTTEPKPDHGPDRGFRLRLERVAGDLRVQHRRRHLRRVQPDLLHPSPCPGLAHDFRARHRRRGQRGPDSGDLYLDGHRRPPTDTDGDGLPDTEETTIGTDPNDADSDDDGVIDGNEPSYDVDSDGDGLINALDPDSDNDGIFDGTELGITSPHADTDVSKGVYVPDADSNTKTDPLKKDTDAGSVPDGAEDTNHNGKIDTGERDPNNPADDVTKPTDTDGDGLSDDEENLIGTGSQRCR